MQIITTEFKGPTNSTGSRIRVRSWLKSISVPYDHSLNVPDVHRRSAFQLLKQLNAERLEKGCERLWTIVADGELPNGKGYGFVIDLIVEVK